MKRGPKNSRSDTKLLLEYEKRILITLRFELGFADPFSMLALYVILVEEVRQLESTTIQELYYCGSYLVNENTNSFKLLSSNSVYL